MSSPCTPQNRPFVRQRNLYQHPLQIAVGFYQLSSGRVFPSILPGCAASPCASPSVVLDVSGAGRAQAAAAFWARGSGGSPTNYTPSAVGGYTLGSRWGDYAVTAADPSPTGPVWLLGEYAQSAGAWGTAVTAVAP